MRRIAVSVVILGFATSIVHAQPSTYVAAPAPSPTAPTAPTSYVQIGLTAGFLPSDFIGTGFNLEGGLRLGPSPLWLHAAVGAGLEAMLLAGNGTYAQVRAGLETRFCSNRALCGFAGVDVGFLNESVTPISLDDDGGSTMMPAEQKATWLVVPRIGIDLGSRSFRIRPTLDLLIAEQGERGFDVSWSIAKEW